MTEHLLSASWHRVADLRPSLVNGIKIVRHQVRGQVWHVLVEPGSGRQVRLNPAAYAFAGRCNGQLTVAALWDQLLRQKGDDAPTQDDVLRLLAQLFRADLVQFDAAPYLSLVFSRRAEEGRVRRKGFINPMMLRLRLLDPSAALDRLMPLANLLWRRSVFWLWLVGVALAALACAVGYAPLKADVLRLLSTPSSFALAWICYPLVKGLHEFGHAMAVRRFGGEVHEMGISLLLLTPAPYVDASAANAFSDARQRAAVSAAGIMVELGLAAVATWVWSVTGPGLVHDTALVVLLICSISTVLFNANPLLRLDGYYLLTDLLALPNLAMRSQAWWSTQWARWTRGGAAVSDNVLGAGELKWLLVYGPAAWLYRAVLLTGLVFWVGQQSWLLGWLAALGVLFWLGKSAFNFFLRPSRNNPDASVRRQTAWRASGLVAGVLVFLFVVPWPSSVVTRGVVWPPDHAQLRTEAAGFVQETLANNGTLVVPGEVVLQLRDLELVAQHDRAVGEQAGLYAQQYQALLSDPARAGHLAESIARSRAEVSRADEQLAQLQLRSRAKGQVVWPRQDDLAGAYAPRGEMLGYVVSNAPANVRLVLHEGDMQRVRGRIQNIEVRLADTPSVLYPAVLVSEAPAATRMLPSAALGDRFGGPVVVDPAEKDGKHTRLGVFTMDVSVPELVAGRIGGRAWVKLSAGYEPLGWQWYRRLRHLLATQFNPAGRT